MIECGALVERYGQEKSDVVLGRRLTPVTICPLQTPHHGTEGKEDAQGKRGWIIKWGKKSVETQLKVY